jgi:polysaccharide biosynthesis transport protein
MPQYDLNLRDYWRIFRKRKWSILFLTLAFGTLAFLFAQMEKPTAVYQSTAVVKWEHTTTFVGLLVETISLSSGDNMATQAALVRSFPVLERAAKAIRLVPGDADSAALRQNPRYIQLLTDLRDRITAIPEENTTLINISATSPEPAQAARMANAVAQAYQEENRLIRNQRVIEARRFIETQVTEVGVRLQQAENAFREARAKHGLIALPEETAALITRITSLETEYEKIRADQGDAVNQILALQALQTPARISSDVASIDLNDPAIVKLNSVLVDLTLERQNLLTTITPDHPQIRDLDVRIALVKQNLDNRERAVSERHIRDLRIKRQVLERRASDIRKQIDRTVQEQKRLPELAREYAQLQREVTLNENLLTQLRSKLQEVQIKEREQIEEVSSVRPAISPSIPMNPPQTTGKAIAGLLIGLTIGVILAFVLESLDTSIATIQDVESYLDLRVLGLIPLFELAKDPSMVDEGTEAGPFARTRSFLISLLHPRSTIAEAYRSLRTNLEFISLEKPIKTICLTSSSLMEGKTTTAVNLAITIAQTGKRTLLVEADLRKPFLHHVFGIPREPGLSEVIVANKDWKDCLRGVADLMLGPLGVDRLMTMPNIDKLSVLTSGTPPPNPTEFLSSPRMAQLITEAREEFDYVIFDCPPVLPVTDTALLASKVDGVLMVYRVGKIARSALRRSKVLLENVRGKVLGIVLTGLKAEISPDYDELKYYHYAYGGDSESSNSERLEPMKRSLWAKLKGYWS